MTDYPRLTDMGVTHFDQIARFSINSIEYTDYLRIAYERPKGSFLPVSRTYHFPRVQKAAKEGAETVMESNPALREALEEPSQLLEGPQRKQDIAAEMLAELQWLDEEFCMYREHLKGLIEKVKTLEQS